MDHSSVEVDVVLSQGAELTANRAHFPCGVDLLLAADGEIAALPRTARLVNEDK